MDGVDFLGGMFFIVFGVWGNCMIPGAVCYKGNLPSIRRPGWSEFTIAERPGTWFLKIGGITRTTPARFFRQAAQV